MASNRLTWRDVAAPDYGSTMRGAEAANRMFQEALGGLSTSLDSFKSMRNETHEGDFLRQLAAVSGDTEQEAALRRGLSENKNVSNAFIGNQLTDFRNSQLSGNTTAENLAQTVLTNQRTNRDNESLDRFRPTAASIFAHVSGGGGNPIAAMSAEDRAAYDALPLAVQRELQSAWSGEQTSYLNRDNTHLNMRQTKQNMSRAATRFSNEISDREVSQLSRMLAYEARQYGLNPEDHAAYITANAPNNLVAATAMQLLPTTTTATGESPGGGGYSSGGRGGAGSGTNIGSIDGSLPSDEARDRALTGLDVQSRINQEENISRVDELTRLENDKTPEYAVVDQMIGEGGAFPGASRGNVLRELQKVMQEQGVNAPQAGSILSRNTRPETAMDKAIGYLPPVLLYRATLGEFPVSGGGLRLNEEGVKGSSGLVGSEAYQQQREAQAERSDALRLMDGLVQQREAAQARAAQAVRQERATGGAYDPTAELDAVAAIDAQLQLVQQGIEANDSRFGRLIRDPDNPRQFTTSGELRERRIQQQEARVTPQQRARERATQLKKEFDQLVEDRRRIIQDRSGDRSPERLKAINEQIIAKNRDYHLALANSQ